MLKIKWTDRISNEEILNQIKERRSILQAVVNRRVQLIGHILRHGGILLTIIEGLVDGKRPGGRLRLQFMDQIMKDVGCKTYEEMKGKADRREEWRVLIAGKATANQSLD